MRLACLPESRKLGRELMDGEPLVLAFRGRLRRSLSACMTDDSELPVIFCIKVSRFQVG